MFQLNAQMISFSGENLSGIDVKNPSISKAPNPDKVETQRFDYNMNTSVPLNSDKKQWSSIPSKKDNDSTNNGGITEQIMHEYFPSGGFTLIRYNDPGEWNEVNAIDNDIAPITKDDPDFDSTPQLVKITNYYQSIGKRVKIIFPDGNYYFQSPCTLKVDDGLWLYASGKEKTRFILDCKTEKDKRLIQIEPASSDDFTEVMSGPLKRGQNSIKVADTNKYKINDIILLRQSRFPVTVVEWQKTSSNRQLCKITDIDNEKGLLILDRAMGIDFKTTDGSDDAQISIIKLSYATNVRVEGIHFERNMNGEGGKNLALYRVHNALVANCAFNWTITFGIHVNSCHNTEIRGCTAEHWYTHTAGGGPKGIPESDQIRSGSYGDAIGVQYSTGVSIYNCTTKKLRHPFWIGSESSYVICAYNRSLAPYDSYGDIGIHHGGDCHTVIFEGNYGNQICIDPKGGGKFDARNVVFFRNKALEHIGNWKNEPHNGINEADRIFIVGNEVDCIPHPNNRHYLGTGVIDKGTNTFKGANLVIDRYENTDITENDKLPASYIFDEKPDWLKGQWPLYGPRL